MKKINVGYPKYWGPLIPTQQCTAIGDALLSNQFERLVRIGADHLIYPLLAKSWEVNDDFTVFKFKIDVSKKFSNGESLNAKHIKKAWEESLSMKGISYNKGAAETLSYIKGFENYNMTKTISGIEVEAFDVLKITFKRPYRLALDVFAVGRLGVFIKRDNQYLGTGRYIIKQEVGDKNTLQLLTNPHHIDQELLSDITVKHIGPSMAKESLIRGDIDVYDFAFNTDFYSECKNEGTLMKCKSGAEAAHLVAEINGSPDSFFNNKDYRKALQYLIIKNIVDVKFPNSYKSGGFKVNPQMYLPLQKGSIDDEREVDEIINEGKAFLTDMITQSQKKPIRFFFHDEGLWLFDLLKKSGVKLTENSGKKDYFEIIKMVYGENPAVDISLHHFSVINGDPDGIYHFLGPNGAILLPMIYRQKVGNLLEKGRSIFEPGKIDAHYQKVSKAVLEEVPFVHIGFTHGLSVYRQDKVKSIKKITNREDNRLHFYRKI